MTATTPATTHPNFNENTEALEVAEAFAGGIRGKTVLVTGVNLKGIGFPTAEAFASQSAACVIVAGRNLSKLEESVDAMKAKYPSVKYRMLNLNLSSQKDVRAAAAEVLAWDDVPTIDIIVNSAGVSLLPERTLNEDGIIMQFGTNHIGHFLFTCLIMPKLLKAAQGSPRGATRVINVSSLSPTAGGMRWSDLNFEKINKDLPKAEQPNYDVHRAWGYKDPELAVYTPVEGYYQSKIANVLFSIGANKRLYEKHGILNIALHPGVIRTELTRYTLQETRDAIAALAKNNIIKYRTLGAGAATSMVAALDPKLGPGVTIGGKENLGVYLADCQVSDKAHPLAESSEEAEKLWKVSEDLVGQKFAW